MPAALRYIVFCPGHNSPELLLERLATFWQMKQYFFERQFELIETYHCRLLQERIIYHQPTSHAKWLQQMQQICHPLPLEYSICDESYVVCN